MIFVATVRKVETLRTARNNRRPGLTDIHVGCVLVVGGRANGRGESQFVLDVVRSTARCLPVRSESRCADVLLVAYLTGIRSLVRVQPLVQLQVDELSELGGAEVAGVGFLARVQAQMSLQVRGRAEPLLADVALVRFFACCRKNSMLQQRM